jgi:hypothetical protein
MGRVAMEMGQMVGNSMKDALSSGKTGRVGLVRGD